MSDSKKPMDRSEIVEKVLAMNPQMRLGDMSAEQMSEHLLNTVRQSKRPPRFSDDKFVAIFNGMLDDLTADFDKRFAPLEQRQEALDGKGDQSRERLRERIADFLAGTFPGEVSDTARDVLRQHAKLLEQLDLSISNLGKRVRDKSAKQK